MSEIEHYRGILKEVARLDDESLESQCKRLLHDDKLRSYEATYTDALLDRNYQIYIIKNDVLYEVSKVALGPDGDIFNMYKNNDGTLSFEVRYYNGGCGFDEAIEEAFSNMKEAL